MSVIALPPLLGIGGCSIGQARYDQLENSDATGHHSVILFGPPRWILTLSAPAHLPISEASLWESLLLKLRGGANHLSAWDPIRRHPEGTMRGSMILNGAHSAGASSLSIVASGQTNKTLLAGDWLQIATGVGTSQLVKVVDNATSDGSAGVIGVNIEPSLRIAFSNGTVVNWDKSLGYYRMMSAPNWAYGYGRTQNGFTAELLESWTT